MSQLDVSIVIPTYKEAENIPRIAADIQEAMTLHSFEIIFVDDNSADGSVEAVAGLVDTIPAQILVRTDQRGLSTAVIHGIEHAQGQYVVVMDCDLSHPARAITPMVEMLQQQVGDFVVGSRYIDGGSFDETWGRLRLLNSKIATWLALPICKVQDPMSGFFAFERDHLKRLRELTPTGYKIGLEIMVKGQFTTPAEYPIHFQDRQFGESKLSFKEQLLYLRHLRRLYKFKFPTASEFVQFGLVGFTGFIIDSLVYFGLQLMFGMNHTLARAISFWPAVTWNWFWNRTVTFTGRKQSMKLVQWFYFVLTSLGGFIMNFGSYSLLTLYVPFFIESKFLAFVIGILVGMGFNFMVARVFVFRPLNQAVLEEASIGFAKKTTKVDKAP